MPRTKQQSDPTRNTREEVARLEKAGLSAAEIAAALGITVQRVYQHLAALKENGEKR